MGWYKVVRVMPCYLKMPLCETWGGKLNVNIHRSVATGQRKKIKPKSRSFTMVFQPFSHIFRQNSDIFSAFPAISAFQAFPARVTTLHLMSAWGSRKKAMPLVFTFWSTPHTYGRRIHSFLPDSPFFFKTQNQKLSSWNRNFLRFGT